MTKIKNNHYNDSKDGEEKRKIMKDLFVTIYSIQKLLQANLSSRLFSHLKFFPPHLQQTAECISHSQAKTKLLASRHLGKLFPSVPGSFRSTLSRLQRNERKARRLGKLFTFVTVSFRLIWFVCNEVNDRQDIRVNYFLSLGFHFV